MSAEVDKVLYVLHKGQKFNVAETARFATWLSGQRDLRAVAKIADRIRRASDGNFGDVKSAGRGISELRIDYGPGYRVYFIKRGNELVILLCGGDKRSQQADIAASKRLKDEIERDGGTPPL
jgi:putative addiction module killer protein